MVKDIASSFGSAHKAGFFAEQDAKLKRQIASNTANRIEVLDWAIEGQESRLKDMIAIGFATDSREQEYEKICRKRDKLAAVFEKQVSAYEMAAEKAGKEPDDIRGRVRQNFQRMDVDAVKVEERERRDKQTPEERAAEIKRQNSKNAIDRVRELQMLEYGFPITSSNRGLSDGPFL